MKRPFQTESALLADIWSAQTRKAAKLWWLGQSGFLFTAEGRTVLFDPYLSDSLTVKYAGTDKPHSRMTERVIAPERLAGIHVITSSHNHTDHLDADSLLPLLSVNPQASLLIPGANREFVLRRLGPVENRLVAIDAGESIEIAGVHFTGIAAAHNEVERDEQGRCRFLGYVAKVGRFAVYQSGDTLLYPGLASALERFHLDAALLPINGNLPGRRVAGNMDGIQAAQLAKSIRARMAIPHHFDMFEFNTASPEPFEAECHRIGQPYRVLQTGEGLEL